MRVVVDKWGVGVRLVWLIGIFIFVSSMVDLVLYHIILIEEVFHIFLGAVAGGSSGADPSAAGGLYMVLKMF